MGTCFIRSGKQGRLVPALIFRRKKMNEIMKVVEHDGKQRVNARDLHEALGVGAALRYMDKRSD
jgi:hypothetical protein